MRSLYTEDISGTKSRLTIFQKSIFKEKYDNFAKSNQKSPQHKKYQWYKPPQRQGNDVKTSQPRYTLKIMSEHTGLPRSAHFDQFKKINQIQLQKSAVPNNSSILSHIGRHSISDIKLDKQTQRNPYFPHKYDEPYQNKVKWTGRRDWPYDKPSLPSTTKSQLFTYI